MDSESFDLALSTEVSPSESPIESQDEDLLLAPELQPVSPRSPTTTFRPVEEDEDAADAACAAIKPVEVDSSSDLAAGDINHGTVVLEEATSSDHTEQSKPVLADDLNGNGDEPVTSSNSSRDAAAAAVASSHSETSSQQAEQGGEQAKESRSMENEDVPHFELDYDEEGMEDQGKKEAAVAAGKAGKETGKESQEDDKDQTATADHSSDGAINEDEEDDGEVGDDDDEDLEEGELKETSSLGVARKPKARQPCRFFSRGQCTWGSTCRFLHPGVNDKGNYRMLETAQSGGGRNHASWNRHGRNAGYGHEAPGPWGQQVAPAPEPVPPPPPPQDTPRPETAWERGLKQAKELRLKALQKKEEDEDYEEKKRIIGIGDLGDNKDAGAENEPAGRRDKKQEVDPRYGGGYYDEEPHYWPGHYEHYDSISVRYNREADSHFNYYRDKQQYREKDRYRDKDRGGDWHRNKRASPPPPPEPTARHSRKNVGNHGNQSHVAAPPGKKGGKREVAVDISRRVGGDKPSGGSGGVAGHQADQWNDPWRRSKSPKRKALSKTPPSRSRSRGRGRQKRASYSPASSRSYSTGSSYSSRSRSSSFSSYSRSHSSGSFTASSYSRSRSPPAAAAASAAAKKKAGGGAGPPPKRTLQPLSAVTTRKPSAGAAAASTIMQGGGKPAEKADRHRPAPPKPGPAKPPPPRASGPTKPSARPPPSSKAAPAQPPPPASKRPAVSRQQQQQPTKTQPPSSAPKKPVAAPAPPGQQQRRRQWSYSRSRSGSASSSYSYSGSSYTGSRHSRSPSPAPSRSSRGSADSEDMYRDLASPVSSASSSHGPRAFSPPPPHRHHHHHHHHQGSHKTASSKSNSNRVSSSTSSATRNRVGSSDARGGGGGGGHPRPASSQHPRGSIKEGGGGGGYGRRNSGSDWKREGGPPKDPADRHGRERERNSQRERRKSSTTSDGRSQPGPRGGHGGSGGGGGVGQVTSTTTSSSIPADKMAPKAAADRPRYPMSSVAAAASARPNPLKHPAHKEIKLTLLKKPTLADKLSSAKNALASTTAPKKRPLETAAVTNPVPAKKSKMPLRKPFPVDKDGGAGRTVSRPTSTTSSAPPPVPAHAPAAKRPPPQSLVTKASVEPPKVSVAPRRSSLSSLEEPLQRPSSKQGSQPAPAKAPPRPAPPAHHLPPVADRKPTGITRTVVRTADAHHPAAPSSRSAALKLPTAPKPAAVTSNAAKPGVVSKPAKKGKASVSRREELLKQLRAVEDAIARKRAKMN